MSAVFLVRLWLDGLAAALLMLGLAYWWLGNAVHEVAGTAMFLLLVAHNLFNRRWYGSVTRTRAPRGLFNVGVTFALMAGMLTLVVTSALISETLAPYLPSFGGSTARRIHTLAAYWVLIIVGVHLGLRWPLLMAVARNLLAIRQASWPRSLFLRAGAVAVVIHGAWSSAQLDLGAKLSMRMTLDWWSFEESVVGFFVHCIAIVGGVIVVTYYALKLPRLSR